MHAQPQCSMEGQTTRDRDGTKKYRVPGNWFTALTQTLTLTQTPFVTPGASYTDYIMKLRDDPYWRRQSGLTFVCHFVAQSLSSTKAMHNFYGCPFHIQSSIKHYELSVPQNVDSNRCFCFSALSECPPLHSRGWYRYPRCLAGKRSLLGIVNPQCKLISVTGQRLKA